MTQNCFFVAWKVSLKSFFEENILIWRNTTFRRNKIMPISHVLTKLQSPVTPRNKQNSKKIFSILSSIMDEHFYDTTHISLRGIYRSAKNVWTKKKHGWVYSSSRHKWGRNRNSGRLTLLKFLECRSFDLRFEMYFLEMIEKGQYELLEISNFYFWKL